MLVFHLIRDITVLTLTEQTMFHVAFPNEIHHDDDDTFREYSGKTDKN